MGSPVDLREWFLFQERPNPEDLRKLIEHYPCSEYRCPIVMRVFLAGFQTGFKLTDEHGQPTDALRVMADAMGAELCRAEDLPRQERRNFPDHKGVMDSVFKGRWFLRNISTRLRGDTVAKTGRGWAWPMFRTAKHWGLMGKRLTETKGDKWRPMRYVAVCPPDWELGDDVYMGLWKWHRDHIRRRVWDSYEYLATHGAERQPKEVAADGPSKVVPA